MPAAAPFSPQTHGRLLLCAVLLFSAALYLPHGFNSSLGRDDALNLYMAQRLLDAGVPPYRSAFLHQGPGATLLTAANLWLGRALGIGDDIHAVRVMDWLWLSLAHLPLFLLARRLCRSSSSAWLTVTLLASAWGFGIHLIGGPNSKTWATLLMVCQFWLLLERRWLLAGMAAGLAAWIWQPMALLGASALLPAWLLNPASPWRTLPAFALGVLAVCLGMAGFLLATGAWDDFWRDGVLFNLSHVSGGNEPLAAKWARVQSTVLQNFTLAVPWLLIGLGALLWHALRHGWRPSRLRSDPLTLLTLTLPVPLVWTVLDVQSYPDLFVFLPYAAMGFSLAWQAWRPPHWLSLGLIAGIAAVTGLWYASGHSNWLKGRDGLLEQRAIISGLGIGTEQRLLTLGAPQVPVLLGRADAGAYLLLTPDILAHREGPLPASGEAWLAALQTRPPDFIVIGFGSWRPDAEAFNAWLARDYEHQWLGRMDIYRRRP